MDLPGRNLLLRGYRDPDGLSFYFKIFVTHTSHLGSCLEKEVPGGKSSISIVNILGLKLASQFTA